MNRLIDVSHTIEDRMITYKGLPAPVICDFWTREYSQQFYAEGTSFHVGEIKMVANTGTYLDSPFHRFVDGIDISELPLERLAGLPGLVIRVAGKQAITPVDIEDRELTGKAVLFQTGWDIHWRTDHYFENSPFLTAATAQHLVEAGVALVGIDSLNIDDTHDRHRPVHTILLRAGIPIVEHLTGLGKLPGSGFRFFATPVKVKGMGTFPVRAFGIVGER